MTDAGKPTRVLIDAASKPALPRHVKMRHDPARNRWIILAPERVFSPDPIAVAVLELCDGSRTVTEIAEELSRTYSAPQDQILADVTSMLQELADKGVVKA